MKMTTEEAFVKVLQMHGIEHAFGIIGSAFMPISDLFGKAGITFWDVAHESNGGLICDGYTRSTGKMAMAIAQNGPGVTGFVTAVKTAYWNHSPMLLVTPQAANRTIGQGGFQELEQMALFRDIVGYQEEVRDPSRVPEVLNRVIAKAKRLSAPAQINIPRDFWTQVIDVPLPTSLEFERPAGGSRAISEAARLLSEARFPVILSGAGVVLGNAIPECMALAEKLEAPVCNNYQHNDSFPSDHPLSVGPLGYNGSRAAMELIVGLRDQFPRRARAVVAQGPDAQRMVTGEGIVVLIVVADRRLQLFRECHALGNRIAEHNAGPREDHRKPGLRQQAGGFGNRPATPCRSLELQRRRQRHVDDLGPEVAGNVDLRGCRETFGLGDDPIQNLRYATRIANFLLIADDIAEQGHLFELLEASLTDGTVRRLRGDQQHRRMVPISGLDGGHEPRDARPVLRDRHRHLPGRARVAIADETAVRLVRHIPEGDSGLPKEIGNRHERRADDAEGVLDAVHLQHLHEGFFRGHLHGECFPRPSASASN